MPPARLLAPALALLLLLAAAPAPARSIGKESGEPLPRYASLQAAEANLRTGPGLRYPVDWVLVRPDMPVMVVEEFEGWRKVRDFEGTEGWLHRTMLSTRRTIRVSVGSAMLRRKPERAAAITARLQQGVLGALDSCAPDWCRITVSGMAGWVERSQIWGVLSEEWR